MPIGKLFDGPLDVVGDVHGEIAALNDLLRRLGYRDDGSHPAGRRLVFVGDLVDRGPDSPAVVDQVAEIVAAGNAQCVLGNHELNLLLESRKSDNAWWFGTDSPWSEVKPATAAFRKRTGRFFASLPLALERADLRVAHASWHDDSIDKLRGDRRSVRAIHDHYAATIRETLESEGVVKEREAEKRRIGDRLGDSAWEACFLPAHARHDELRQMGNPVKVLSSGQEAPTPTPFWAGGKWRMLRRLRWWDDYAGTPPVIVGHYWRRFDPAVKLLADKYGPDLFAGQPGNAWMGRRRRVYCVDFSVGARSWERQNRPGQNACRLAALQVPEWRVVFDAGEVWQLPPPGTPGRGAGR